jgi:predicted small secreted protein
MRMGWWQRTVVGSRLPLCLGGVALARRHTLGGAGEDIEEAGRSMERTAP